MRIFLTTTIVVFFANGLEDSKLVSGLRGWLNFVAMAHQMPGGRSILMLISTGTKHRKPTGRSSSHC
ncbi:MAG: hypothetical protein LJE63_01885 [Desulfobacteraceae bacterium]|jgi:acyl-CoA hydrolase|nr:hypothetical protein [Desulfobacteraceae bacterium]